MDGVYRAQTSTIGALFAVLLVLVSVTTLSVAALDTLDIEDQTFVGVDVEVTTDAVVVTSEGGEAVPASDLALLVGTDPVERYGVETLTAEDTFEPGDRARVALSGAEAFGDMLAVRVVHEPSERTLFAERLVVRRATAVPVGLGRPVVTGTPTSTPTATAMSTPTPAPVRRLTPSVTPTSNHLRTQSPTAPLDPGGPAVDSVSTNAYKSGDPDFLSATASISGADGDERAVFELRDCDERYAPVVRLFEDDRAVDIRTAELDGP